MHSGTADAAAKPLVLVHANWQATPLVMLLRKTPMLAHAVEIRLFDDHEPLEQILRSDRVDRTRLVAVWQQVIAFWLREEWATPIDLPDSVELVRFPYLEARCFWPLAGSDPRNQPEDLYPHGRYGFSDRHAAALSESDGSDDELYAEYLARSQAAPQDLDAALIADLAMMATRDALCDIPFTLFFIDGFRREKLLHASASPTGASYRWLAMRLAERLAPRAGLDRAAAAAAVARQAYGLDGISQHQFPVHPGVVGHFGLNWCAPETAFRFGGSLWTHRDGIVRSIRWLDWAP